MLTANGKSFAMLSTTLPSDCTAPAPTLIAIEPASAALTVGIELTVECTLACALATPARSAEHPEVATHNRRNRIGNGTRTLELQLRTRRSVSALGSLLHREVREPQHEFLRRRVVAPRDVERTAAV